MRGTELRIPADVRYIRSSRQWVRRQAEERGAAASTLRVVELLTSEVVTNAVKYGQGDEVTVCVGMDRGEMEVSVHDQSSEPPVLLDPRSGRHGGRGMRLVASLADEWGVHQHRADGKSVWFRLPLQPRGQLHPA